MAESLFWFEFLFLGIANEKQTTGWMLSLFCLFSVSPILMSILKKIVLAGS